MARFVVLMLWLVLRLVYTLNQDEIGTSSPDDLLVVRGAEDLGFDQKGHLSGHYLLYSDTPRCAEVVSGVWWGDDVKNRARRTLGAFAVTSQFGRSILQENEQVEQALMRDELCVAVSLQQGLPRRMITFVERRDYFFLRLSHTQYHDDILKWMLNLQRVEIGLTSSYMLESVSVVHHVDCGKINFQELEPGQHMSFHADLGSTITVLTNHNRAQLPNDPDKYIYTGDVVLSHEVRHHATLFTDYLEEMEGDGNIDLVRRKTRRSRMSTGAERERFEDHPLERMTDLEFTEADRRRMRANISELSVNSLKKVERTFSKMGFELGRLPKDLWASMATYYYNNQLSTIVEFWNPNDVITNHYDVESDMAFVPFGLQHSWQARIQHVVAKWVNRNIGLDHVDLETEREREKDGLCKGYSSSKHELGGELEVTSNLGKQCLHNAIRNIGIEQTSLYGIRVYKRGARLMHHVDKVATHAASVIINVAQEGITEPWPLEILDHSGRLHRVLMTEGDIVYYESSRLLHGRISPFRGESFANIFAHYRPLISHPSDESSASRSQKGDPLWYTQRNPLGTVKPVDEEERRAAAPAVDQENATDAAEIVVSKKGGGGRGANEYLDEFRFVDASSSGESFDFSEGLTRLWDEY